MVVSKTFQTYFVSLNIQIVQRTFYFVPAFLGYVSVNLRSDTLQPRAFLKEQASYLCFILDMKKRLSSVSYEGMRLRAVELFRSGRSRQEIMAGLGIPKSTLSRWLARYDAENPDWYKSLPPGGTQGKLGEDDLRRLVEELNKGCAAQGFEGEIWTRRRVGAVIERLF